MRRLGPLTVAAVATLTLAAVTAVALPGGVSWAAWGGNATGQATAKAMTLAAPSVTSLSTSCQNKNRGWANASWSQVSYATGYRVQFSLGSDFSPLLFEKTTTKDVRTAQSSEFDPPVHVYVRVQTIVENWNGPWSSVDHRNSCDP